MQRKDGRWQILIRHTDAYGVRKRVTVTGKTAKESRQKAEEVRARLKKQLPARDTRQLVDQYAETWIKTTLANSDRKTSTKSMYAAVARHHIIGSQLGATPMHRVRPSAVDGWLAELRRKGLSDSTRRNAYTILRAVFDAAVKDRELADNPRGRGSATPGRGEGGGVPHSRACEESARSGQRYPLQAALRVLGQHWPPPR